jgi:hypothetical protein
MASKREVPALTVDNLRSVSFSDMLAALRPLVLEEVPEDALNDPEVLTDLDRLMGRFANLYSLLIDLHAAALDWASRFKLVDNDAEYQVMMKKKDALWELSRAVKLKYEACSRKLTLHIEAEERDTQPANYPARQERAKGRGKPKPIRGWGNVT